MRGFGDSGEIEIQGDKRASHMQIVCWVISVSTYVLCWRNTICPVLLLNSFLTLSWEGALYCEWIYINKGMPTITSGLSSCPAREEDRIRPLVLFVFMERLSVSVICVDSAAYIWYMCVLTCIN